MNKKLKKRNINNIKINNKKKSLKFFILKIISLDKIINEQTQILKITSPIETKSTPKK